MLVPPSGYMAALRACCDAKRVLLVADALQAGLGRTGATLAMAHEGVRADMSCLGKALGGGLLPVSAVVGHDAVMNVRGPGDHGSTFGGNALAARVGREALAVLADEALAARATRLGAVVQAHLRRARHSLVREWRGRGPMIGVALHEAVEAHEVVERLARAGALTKDTHGNTVRLSPPPVLDEPALIEALDTLLNVLDDCASAHGRRVTEVVGAVQ